MENIKIVLRYNADADNIECFSQYLADLKSKISFTPIICVNYTVDFECGTEYENKLIYDEFVKWSSTVAIDLLIETGFNVNISPLISIEECQFRSKYSLKLFSDGTIGSCATNFFDKKRKFLKDIMVKPANDFWIAKEHQTLLADEECMRCPTLFLCGGTIKLPCLQPLTSTRCDINGSHMILLDEFLKRYVQYENEGKGDMFSVFKSGIAFR
jgi:radical SAM protein with 4Fe4S-binding SPASM domain